MVDWLAVELGALVKTGFVLKKTSQDGEWRLFIVLANLLFRDLSDVIPHGLQALAILVS